MKLMRHAGSVLQMFQPAKSSALYKILQAWVSERIDNIR